MTSVLWTVLAVAVCVGMLVVAHRIEPHWISKDGQRFLTTSEQVDRLGNVIGRRREVRGSITADGRVVLRHRAFLRSTNVGYAVEAKSPRPPAGRALYVLRPVPAAADGSMLVLRVPARSELVAVLDRLSAGQDVSAPTPDP